MLCRDREGSAIAKKLQKSRDFCFRNELVAEAEAELLKSLNAEAGKISRWGESRERRAKPAAEREVAGGCYNSRQGQILTIVATPYIPEMIFCGIRTLRNRLREPGCRRPPRIAIKKDRPKAILFNSGKLAQPYWKS